MKINLKGKKCTLFFSGFLVCSILTSSFATVFTTHAISDYDNAVQLTPDLHVSDGAGRNDDVSTTYLSAIQSANETEYNNFSNCVLNSPTCKWVIWQRDLNITSSSPGKVVRIAYGNSLELNFATEDSVTVTGITGQIEISPAEGSAYSVGSGIFTNGATVSTSDGGDKLFLSTAPITYPDGYSGATIPDSYTPISTYYPGIRYIVASQNLQAFYTKNIPYDNTSVINLNWKLVNSDSSQTLYDTNQDSVAPFNADNLPLGHYDLELTFSVKPPGVLPDDLVVHQTVQHLNIDGNSYDGYSTNNDCSDGVCSAPSTYKDCSTYGTDIIGGIGCQFTNFGTWLKSTLITLFVPSSSSLSDFFDNAHQYLSNKLGFLMYPFDWIYTLLQTMSETTSNCVLSQTPGLPSANMDGHLFGHAFSLNLCSAQSQFSQFWNITVFLVRAMFIFVLVMGIYRKLRLVIGQSHSLEDISE